MMKALPVCQVPSAPPGPSPLPRLEGKGHTLGRNTGRSGRSEPPSRSSSFLLSGPLPPFLFPSIFSNKWAQTYQTLLLGSLQISGDGEAWGGGQGLGAAVAGFALGFSGSRPLLLYFR